MKMNIEALINKLIGYAYESKLICESDRLFVRNRLLEIFGLDDWNGLDNDSPNKLSLEEILNGMLDYAAQNGLISGTNESRDLFDTKIMSCFVPLPSVVIKRFMDDYSVSPELATDNYFDWSKKVNYVRAERIEKDRVWKYESEDYGILDISINLSKPEKDPRDIAAAGKTKSVTYPKCQLCAENSGYAGRIGHPARQNLVPILLNVGDEEWFLQYSPYGYYNEHCIVFNSCHIPMKIDKAAFGKLFEIVERLPHYFVGSNADLPIVGGSILSHEHFQGGKFEFAMEKAPVEWEFKMKNYPEVKAGIVKWPMSVIRLSARDTKVLEDACDEILTEWRRYSDESVDVFAFSGDVPHNTITPIVRKRGGMTECDLVLRNNRTTDERPMGLFHPNPELHHIKKENIGLIEVMGLAILPSRLAVELDLLKDAIIRGENIAENEKLASHAEWADELKKKYPQFSADNADDIIKTEVGAVFEQVLVDAGVFKRDSAGISAFKKFCLRF